MKKSITKSSKRTSKKTKSDFTILFVCTGNSCRSPIAKGLLDKIINDNQEKSLSRLKIMSLSAGTIAANGQLPSDNAQKAVRKYGADIRHHLSTRLNKERVKMADLILAMEEKHKLAVLELMPSVKDKTFIITEYVSKNKDGIADPIGQPLEKYQETVKLLNNLLLKVYKKILTKIK